MLRNMNVIKRIMAVTYFVQLSNEDDFSSLFARIWIKIHFPMESPIINFSQVIIQFVFVNVPSAKSLALEERLIPRSLM